MIKAAQRFNAARGFKFITYAVWWIRRCINQGLDEKGRTVRLPGNQINDFNKLEKTRIELTRRLGNEPTNEEIADKMGIALERLHEILTTNSKTISMDYPTDDADPNLTLQKILYDENDLPTDHDITLSESDLPAIEKAIATLKPREAEIIKRYFGLDGDTRETLEQLGERFHRTRERVHQIKKSNQNAETSNPS